MAVAEIEYRDEKMRVHCGGHASDLLQDVLTDEGVSHHVESWAADYVEVVIPNCSSAVRRYIEETLSPLGEIEWESEEADISEVNDQTYSDFSDEDLRILHAAMTSMTQGVHACQDTLSEAEWDRAEEIWEGLDEEINTRDSSS